MAVGFLLLFSAFLCVGLAAPSADCEKDISRGERSTDGDREKVAIDFTVRRLQPDHAEILKVMEGDPFCDEGVDIPGNITIHTFYRDRLVGDDVGNWTLLQRDSALIGGRNRPLSG